MKLFDLSQRIDNGMPVYPGDMETLVVPIDRQPPWMMSELHLGTHTGTHIDAARHHVPSGTSIDAYPLERFVLRGAVIDVSGLADDATVTWKMIETAARRLPPGGAAVLRTGWDGLGFWDSEHRLTHPYLGADAARRLADAGVTLVATDCMSIDSSVSHTETAHDALLSRDVLIVESLVGLQQLEAGRVYRFSFLPLRLTGLDGSPIRAVAWEE